MIEKIDRIVVGFYGPTGETITPGTIYPMVYQDGDGTWEPYKSQTVRLISPRPLTKWDKLEKRDGKWGWLYGGKVLEFDGTEGWELHSINDKGIANFRLKVDFSSGSENYCNYFSKYSRGISEADSDGFVISDSLYVRMYESITATVEEWKAWLNEKKEDGVPMYMAGQLAEPEWVELSESEQAAMKALETYYPTTVIQNNANSQMRLQYVADPEHYLEQHYQNKIDTIDTLAERVAALETNTIKEV